VRRAVQICMLWRKRHRAHQWFDYVQITYSRFNQASGPPSALWDMNADVPFVKPERGKGKGGGGGGAARETKFDELTANAAPVEQWVSQRPPLPQCTPQTFMNDLINFLTVRSEHCCTTLASLPHRKPCCPSLHACCSCTHPVHLHMQ
jgi:hypothetical protein